MEYIRVTKENLEREHICGAISNNKDVQVSSKKAWLADRFDEGLVFLKSVERGKCFIEYITSDDAVYTEAVKTSTYWPVRDIEGIYDGDDIMTEYGMFMQYMGDYYQVTAGWAQARTSWWNMLQDIGEGADIASTVDTFMAEANTAAAG